MNTIMRRMLSAVVVLSLAACGDEYTPNPGFEDNRQISPDFAGDWSGNATLYIGNAPQGQRPVDVAIRVEVNGPDLDATISPICGPEAVTLQTEGNGKTAMWYGDVTCPAATDACQSLTIRYTSALLKVLGDGRFYTIFQGEATGCGQTADAHVEVYAVK